MQYFEKEKLRSTKVGIAKEKIKLFKFRVLKNYYDMSAGADLRQHKKIPINEIN